MHQCLGYSKRGGVRGSTNFDSPGEESSGQSFDPIPIDEWVHLRLLCVGNTIRMYINGVQDATAAVTTTTLDPIGDCNPMNRFRMFNFSTGAFLDDCRAAIGGSASTDNFTPPVAPWPNP